MSSKRFLKESRTKQISEQEIRSLLATNCKQFKPHKIIYRGLKDRFDYGFIDPKKGNTIYTESTSYYSFLVDWAWKKHPKREKSVIGTPDKRVASEFGDNVYALIPYDNAHFGVCPTQDFWNSFQYLFKETGLTDMLEFDRVLGNIINKHGATRPLFFRLLKDVATKWDDKEKVRAGINSAPKGFKYLPFMKYVADNPIDKFSDILKDLLDPKKNNIKEDRYQNLNPRIFRTDHELWTSSKCLLIHETKLNEFFNLELQEQMLVDINRRKKANKMIGERRVEKVMKEEARKEKSDEYTQQRIKQSQEYLRNQ
jgi:hypothetical protein